MRTALSPRPKNLFPQLETVGWRERVALPEFGVKEIKAKVDTGAKTSALHVTHIEKIPRSKFIQFKIHPNQDSRNPVITAQAPVLEYRSVKSSNGVTSLRPVIQTDITIGDQTFPIELTLVNRDMMGFRMLLGREAVRNRFLVHSGKSFLQGKMKKKKRSSKKKKTSKKRTRKRSRP